MKDIKYIFSIILMFAFLPATAQDTINEPSASQEHKIKLSFQYGRFKAHNS